MGEWFDYFEDFPEENLANWTNGYFDPNGVVREKEWAAQKRVLEAKVVRKCKEERDEIQQLIEKHSPKKNKKQNT